MVSRFRKLFNNSIRPLDVLLTDTTIPGQSWHGSNGNKGVLNIPESFRTRTLPSEGLLL